jgi:hypothetical protein
MSHKTIQFQSHTEKESFISIDELHTGSANSYIFRNILISEGYLKFDAQKIKGDFCYDAYLKEFSEGAKLKYTIYCYCYDLRKVMEDHELFEFCFEVQIESEKGIFGIESIQWDFRNPINAKENLNYFQTKIEKIWQELGKKYFPG